MFQNAGTIGHDHNIFASGVNVGVTMSGDEHAGDPGFVDRAALDLHLAESSIAVDVGTATVFATDFDGTAMPTGGGVDIGAFEYNPGGPPMDGGVGMLDASPINWGTPAKRCRNDAVGWGSRWKTDMGSFASDAGSAPLDGGGGGSSAGCTVDAAGASRAGATGAFAMLIAIAGHVAFARRRRSRRS